MTSDAQASPPSPAPPQPTFTNQIPADRRYWVLGAVMLVQFTSVLASTIVSTAAPTIVDELHGLDLYAWLFTSYLLASSWQCRWWASSPISLDAGPFTSQVYCSSWSGPLSPAFPRTWVS